MSVPAAERSWPLLAVSLPWQSSLPHGEMAWVNDASIFCCHLLASRGIGLSWNWGNVFSERGVCFQKEILTPKSKGGDAPDKGQTPECCQSLKHVTKAPRGGTKGQAILKELDRLAPQNKMSLLSPWGREEGGRGRGKSREGKEGQEVRAGSSVSGPGQEGPFRGQRSPCRQTSGRSVSCAKDCTMGPSRRSCRHSKEQCPRGPCRSHRQRGKPFVLVLETFPAGFCTPHRAAPNRGPRGPYTPTGQLERRFLHPLFSVHH